MLSDSSRRLLTAIAALALLAAALPAAIRSFRPTSAPQFDLPERASTASAAPLFSSEFLPAVNTGFVHAATLTQLQNGDLLAAWYGGTDEVEADVRIFTARLDHSTGRWSAPLVAESREHAEKALGLHVKSLGNPVLLANPRGGVSLFFVTVYFGGWSGASICMKTSPDGTTWSDPRPVYTSPFMNVGMLVRGRPWMYRDGTIALPVYHQLLRKWSAIARLDGDGRVIDIARIADSRPLIQPWIVPTGGSHAMAFMRWSSRVPGRVTFTNSDDAGVHWSDISATRLVHRDSGIAGARLSDGSILAIYNNTSWDRRDLSIARSKDGGVHWSQPHPLERDTTPDSAVRREYSYPYLFQTTDGRYHIVYTWQRTRIRHVTFNDSWVFDDSALGGPAT